MNWAITLPFEISRWWDVLTAPIWSSLIILSIMAMVAIEDGVDSVKNPQLKDGLIYGLVWLIKILFSLNFWCQIGQWLIGR